MPSLDTIDTTTPLIGLDIETDTTIDGLNPRQSSVLAVAISGGGIEAVLDGPDERSVLVETDRLLASIGAGVLVTWNGSGFDLPFIATRARILGLSLGLITRHDPTIAGRHDPLPGDRWVVPSDETKRQPEDPSTRRDEGKIEPRAVPGDEHAGLDRCEEAVGLHEHGPLVGPVENRLDTAA